MRKREKGMLPGVWNHVVSFKSTATGDRLPKGGPGLPTPPGLAMQCWEVTLLGFSFLVNKMRIIFICILWGFEG